MQQAGIALTEQFYDWEQRGRGWLLAPAQTAIEPPFHPFFEHRVSKGYLDDGKRSTWLSDVADIFRTHTPTPTIEAPAYPDIEFFPSQASRLMRTAQICFPKSVQPKPDRMEQLLVMLTRCTSHLSFEIIATDRTITFQLVARESDYPYVRSQLEAFFPECIITDQEDALQLLDGDVALVDFGLSEEFMRPIATYTGSESDPFTSIMGLLEHLNTGEQAVLQILFEGAVNAWTGSIHRSVSDGAGGSFFWNSPEMPKLAQEKTARPLYGACVRLCTQAPTPTRARSILQSIAEVLMLSTASSYNRFIGLSDQEYDADTRLMDILERQSHRIGMLLNVRELMTLVHFPGAHIRSHKLARSVSVSKAPPERTHFGEYVLGINTHRNVHQFVCLSDQERLQHIHIIGATGTGKSTLLGSLIYQDIQQGSGIAVLDPHGDLVDTVLSFIPESRINDVVLIDPSDTDYAVGFNMLHAHTPLEQELLSSDLVALFRRFSTSWGDQMNSVFANAIMAILACKDGGTLLDLRRFLIEKSFRDKILATVTDQAILYYWQHEYPLLKSSSLGSILTRLDTFLRPRMIRAMVSQRKSLNFDVLMDEKKIVLVKLAQGLMGTENSFILGASIIAKFQQAAVARQSKAQHTRTPYYLYIDEFHHFATPSMQSILSGARKYGLGLVVAHQSMSQLAGDSGLASAITANAGTRICFRLGDTDAKRFAEGFTDFTAEHLQNLAVGEAIARIGRAEDDFSLTSLNIPLDDRFSNQEAIITHSRCYYATPITDSTPPISSESQSSKPITQPIQKEERASTEDIVEQLVEREQVRKHRYLQTLIKKMAEERGYKAQLEVPLAGGNGRVDVSLERNDERIAIEISVSTGTKWELHNIEKCLQAGYQTVCWCSTDKTALQKMRSAVQTNFSPEQQMQIVIAEPEFLLTMLEPIPTQQPTHTIKGYRVSVAYDQVSDVEQGQKRATVAAIIRQTLKK